MSSQSLSAVHESAPAASPTPMILLQIAMDQKADIDKLTRLWELQKDFEANEARKAFAADFVLMKPDLPLVIRRKDNTQTRSKYAPLEDVNVVVDPILRKYGFGTATKIVAQDEVSVTVSAELWHRDGHIERTEIKMPLDGTGIKGTANKTEPHALSSSVSYGKRVTVCALLNISTGDDKDGNGGSTSGSTLTNLQERCDWIENCRNVDEVDRIFRDAYKAASDAKDENAKRTLIIVKDKRKAELKGAASAAR